MSVTETDIQPKKRGWIHEIISTVVYPLLAVLAVYSFLYQPFRIPSGSMVDTLLVGDYVWVNKFAYGYSRHSLPLSPKIFDGRIWGGMPERGDVIVFKLPADNATDYIKRLVGLPGDRIQMIKGVLHINGAPVKLEFLGEEDVSEDYGSVKRYKRYRETLPNGVVHEILRWQGDTSAPNDTAEFLVPEGHFFFMGDNRDSSQDSRFLDKVGYVPYENLVGRADLIFPSIDSSARWFEVWYWPGAIRWSRLFHPVR